MGMTRLESAIGACLTDGYLVKIIFVSVQLLESRSQGTCSSANTS
jgi:hypothetical protein